MTIVVGVVAVILAGVLRAQTRTVWDGVYTIGQADRAAATFDTVCVRCHTLTGDGRGSLTGDAFWTGFTQKTVGDLLTYVKTSMPNGNAGSLPASTYNDLVALILKSNGFPAGGVEVSPDSVADIRIIPKNGATELPPNVLARVVGCLAKSGNDWVVTHATAPERIDTSGAGQNDATRPLGTGAITLKFVLTRLDSMIGHRVSVSGILIGAGGVDGINVTTVNHVADSCL